MKFSSTKTAKKLRSILIVVTIILMTSLPLPAANASLYKVFDDIVSAFGIDISKFTDGNALPESFMSIPEMIQYNLYPVEIHKVVTEDGYILELHRIPHGRFDTTRHERKHPVLFIHGITGSSGCWTSNGPRDSFAFVLADDIYDVWLINLRGNKYSKLHSHLPSDDPSFWEFSLDDHSKDLTASIDYILETTGFNKLSTVGHSLGSAILMMLLASETEYNNKVDVVMLEAPAIYIREMTSIVRPVAMFLEEASVWANIFFGATGIGTSKKAYSDLLRIVCSNKLLIIYCKSFFMFLGGYSDHYNEERMHIQALQFFTGMSWNVAVHYSQIYRTDRFQRFDYGRSENLRHYNQEHPPAYDLSQVSSPVVIFWSKMDALATENDVARFAKEIPNLHHHERIAERDWQHADFIFSKDLKKLHIDRFLEVMENVRAGNTTSCSRSNT